MQVRFTSQESCAEVLKTKYLNKTFRYGNVVFTMENFYFEDGRVYMEFNHGIPPHRSHDRLIEDVHLFLDKLTECEALTLPNPEMLHNSINEIGRKLKYAKSNSQRKEMELEKVSLQRRLEQVETKKKTHTSSIPKKSKFPPGYGILNKPK